MRTANLHSSPKFGTREWTNGVLYHAKFHPDQYIVLIVWAEKCLKCRKPLAVICNGFVVMKTAFTLDESVGSMVGWKTPPFSTKCDSKGQHTPMFWLANPAPSSSTLHLPAATLTS